MTEPAFQRCFADILSRVRQPARLIGGEAGAGPGFAHTAGEFRVVLGFPDAYEVGISNQALQILYALARDTTGVAVERTYLPWVDAIAEMRRQEVPLLTLETWTPVAKAHLFALTLQHESTYTNVLEMLDLAGIPLHAGERKESQPLVVAGGPASANFRPMSRFLDAVAVGDGEELFPEILAVLTRAQRDEASRAETKARLSRIAGVFVPGISGGVTRRVRARLEDAPYPVECLVPLTAGVHDRVWIEVMRGCTRGCRFCQAGMWYRPVRERSPEQVLSMAGSQLAASGHQELAFASLSTTDYSCLEEVLGATARAYPEVRLSLPSLRVDSAAVRLAQLASPTGGSLTLAPEAGSQRMRDIINKNVTESDVLAAAAEAFRAGRTTLKLYFMIGLPHETDEDVAAIAGLCLAVRDVGRSILGARSGRLRLNVGVNSFIPKPFTPFQWAAMAGRETLRRRQDLLRSRLRRPGVRLDLSGVDRSYIEAALARGGEEMGTVIEEAWRRGARFDSWTEEFRRQAWDEAFASVGTSAEALATTPLACEAPLPWDAISGVVDKDFLRAEWEKAARGETTPDCRWEGCSLCGACPAGPANDLAAAFAPLVETPGTAAAVAPRAAASPASAPSPAGVAGAGTGSVEVAAVPPGTRRRYAATFAVTGRGRFIGHLDRVEIVRRAVRKAGGRLALSAGLRPKPLLSLALPLGVGVEGLRELAEFELAEEPGSDFRDRLAAALPSHMPLLALERYWGRRSLSARVTGVCYEVQVTAVAGPAEGALDREAGLAEAAATFAAAAECPVEEVREGRVRTVDLRRYVDAVSVGRGPGPGLLLSFTAAVTPSGTARPERVVDALARLADVTLETGRIVRTRIHLAETERMDGE